MMQPPVNGYGPPPPPVEARRANQNPNVARIVLNVPEDARVYLQDQRMTLTGPVRRFVSPQLQNGRDYLYTIRVEVDRNGETLTRTTEARVRGGRQVSVAVGFDRNDPNRLVSSIR
jgi:uncharacterized protein (TIGR03000 family)